ncbi:MAG: hypothetical protein IKM26_06565 [Clostridia bacterium]|nr:hypothetical protein [Clostridia bacterium]
MLRLQKSNEKYQIYSSDRYIGTVQLYDNPYHLTNCYLHLELKELNHSIGASLFAELKKITHRPLQIMIDSTETSTLAFLTASGFECRRKCYEIEVRFTDYTGGKTSLPLSHCQVGDADYMQSCQLLFDHYVATHKSINPWTADFQTFCSTLPNEVIYVKKGNSLSAAFIEGNEIAYTCGSNKLDFEQFLHCLVSAMFSQYETICFECDHCDWPMMLLKSLFNVHCENSFDTYVLD